VLCDVNNCVAYKVAIRVAPNDVSARFGNQLALASCEFHSCAFF